MTFIWQIQFCILVIYLVYDSSLLLGDGKNGYVDSHEQVLCNIQVFAQAMPSLFAPSYENFFICSSEAYQIKALKLEILSSIATNSSISSIFKEFQVLAAFLRNFLSLLRFEICRYTRWKK